MAQHQTMRFSILGDERNASPSGIGWIPRRGPAAHPNLARVYPSQSDECSRHGRAPATAQSGQPDNFARADGERYVEDATFNIQSTYVQQRFPDGANRIWVLFFQLASDHRIDELRSCRLGDAARHDRPPVL